jgi:hypothetical protein
MHLWAPRKTRRSRENEHPDSCIYQVPAFAGKTNQRLFEASDRTVKPTWGVIPECINRESRSFTKSRVESQPDGGLGFHIILLDKGGLKTDMSDYLCFTAERPG